MPTCFFFLKEHAKSMVILFGTFHHLLGLDSACPVSLPEDEDIQNTTLWSVGYIFLPIFALRSSQSS